MVAQISLYEEGKIDVHNRKAKYQKALLGLSEDKSIVTANRDLIAKDSERQSQKEDRCRQMPEVLGDSQKAFCVVRYVL
jgi:hypothetical protein